MHFNREGIGIGRIVRVGVTGTQSIFNQGAESIVVDIGERIANKSGRIG